MQWIGAKKNKGSLLRQLLKFLRINSIKAKRRLDPISSSHFFFLIKLFDVKGITELLNQRYVPFLLDAP